MLKIIQSTILLVLIYGCGPSVTFDQPQPVDTKSLSKFPNRILGDYLSADQSTKLTIAERTISKTFDYDVKIQKDSLDSASYLKGDTIINRETGEKIKAELTGDSIKVHIHEVDTLFSISDSNVLKKYKGYYFLNIQYDKNAWQVQRLALTKGVLTTGNISDSTDISHLQQITETKDDTASYNFSLTKKQFKTFIKQNGFSDEEVFKRMTKTDR